MEIPEHVRRQAMDAVSHKETTDYIRSFGNGGSADFTPARIETEPPGPLTDEVKRQAMDAISHRETTAQITLASDLGGGSPPATPSAHSRIIAERIEEMHKMGQDVGAIQQTITKDNFGREYEVG